MLRHLLLRRPRRISSFVPGYRFYSLKQAFAPSPEQASIIERCRSRNVVVSARPGVGKTATAEALVQANPHVPIAVITYSKRLQLDTHRRLEGYDHVDTFTFHGLASRLFGGMIHNDGVLRNLRRTHATPSWYNMPKYSYVVLDELQDLTPDLYWLTNLFISTLTRATGHAPQILALGDARQAIYEFRDADARFLDLAPSVFSAISPREWDALALSKSFRLSQETASFVNHAFLGGKEYIVGQRSGGPKPIYAHADMADIPKLLDLIVPLIKQYGPENTAILAPSVRANPLLPPLTNALSKQHHIPVAISTSDDAPLDSDVMNGKITVSTYHQFKGSERDLVIVYGVDAGYFNFMGRDIPDDRCPNTTFVALTRARHQLVLLQAKDWPAMPFVDFNAVKQHAQVLNLTDSRPKRQYDPGRPLRTGLLLPVKVWATEAARHVRDEELHNLVHRHLKIDERAALPSDLSLAATDKVCTDPERNHHEAVSDLNGLAVTAAFEWRFARTLTAFGYGGIRRPDIPEDEHGRGVWLTRDATRYESEVSQYKSRLAQMMDHPFDWLVPFLESATKRLQDELERDGALGEGGKLEFEVPLRRKISVSEPDTKEKQETELVGRPDIVHVQGRGRKARVTIWEIKFVGGLALEHAVQAVVYGYLWALRHKGAPFPKIVLFNVRDGSRWDISTTENQARSLIEGVLRAKYTARGQTPVDVFLKNCEDIQMEVEEVVQGFDVRPQGAGVEIGLGMKPKIRRSHPKVVATRSAPQTRKRAPAPPMKEPGVEAEVEVKPQRGRGRPKKVEASAPAPMPKSTRMSAKTQPPAVPRKRGRPRKIPI